MCFQEDFVMGSHKTARGAFDEDFARAYNDQIEDLEKSRGVLVIVGIEQSHTRRSLAIRYTAFKVLPERGEVSMGSYTILWPGPQARTLPAALFQGAVQFSRLIEQTLDLREGRAPE
jgi:hypothetical protein